MLQLMQNVSSQAIWLRWLRSRAGPLSAGKKIALPRWLPHPARAGFVRTVLAEDVGQVEDWGLRLSDGSRIHVHEFEGGALVAHRDKTDPTVGLLHAVWHWLTETRTGRLSVLLGSGLFALRACRRGP